MARALRTTTFTEPKNISDVVQFEAHGPDYHREVMTVLAGAGVLKPGHVLGRITKATATAAAKSGGNTGNGAISGLATLAGAKIGVYTACCIAAATNSGTFRVTDPEGFVLGDVAVGAAFANDVGFTIADGSSDFVVGDGFDITVAAGSGKLKKYTPTATDGSADDLYLLLQHVDASGGSDVPGVVVLARGPAVLSRLGLEWDTSVDTEGKKDAAIAKLADKDIITRTGA